jgi:hypothetical protein
MAAVARRFRIFGGALGRRLPLAVAALAWLAVQAAPATAAGTYWGALAHGEAYGETGAAPLNSNTWNLFERHAGRSVGVLDQGQGWASFNAAAMDATAARNAIPLVTMGLPQGVGLSEIASGGQDSQIRAWARAAKQWGRPFFFAPWWEMNGGWYAWGLSPSFVAAWRRFHDLTVQEGATNVTWTWVVNGLWEGPEGATEGEPEPYYPGDSYVDWVGIDSYNWGRNLVQPDRWETPDQVLTPTLERVGEIAPGKPVVIQETAASEYGGNKTDWIRELLGTYLPHHTEIGAFLWFNWNFQKQAGGAREDWPIESSAPAQQAFRAGIQSSIFRSAPASQAPLTKVVPAGPAAAGDAAMQSDLSAKGETAATPQVAVAADGSAVVVWSARHQGHFGVFARRIGADGKPAGPATELSAPPGDAFSPQLALQADGSAVVVWTRFDGSHFAIQARRIDPGGSAPSETLDLSPAGQDATEPQLALAPDGTATVVWKRFNGFHPFVQERRIAADWSLEGSVETLSEARQDAVEPQVAVASDGAALVAWSRFDGSNSIVQARSISPEGSPQGPAASLSAAGVNSVEPQLALAPDGSAAVVWSRTDGSGTVIQYHRLAADGSPLGATLDISAAGRSAEPQVAVAGDGSATAVWNRFDGSSFVIQARRISSAGSPQGTVTLSAAGRDAASPQVAIAEGGGADVVWSRFDGTAWVVQERHLDAGGAAAGSAQSLSAAGRSAGAPQIATGPYGETARVWTRFDGADDIVQLALRPPEPPAPPPEEPPPSGEKPPPPDPTIRSGDDDLTGEPHSEATAGGRRGASLRLGRLRLNLRTGTARLPVFVPGPGRLLVTGAGRMLVPVDAARRVTLRLAPRGERRRVLLRRGRLRLRVTISFAAADGPGDSRRLTVVLRRKLPRRG